MSDSQDLLTELCRPFPDHAIEEREGAFGKMLSYVAAETVIRRLNRVCPEWSFRQTAHEWTEPMHWTDKNGKERTSRTLVYWGELTIPGLGTRSGTGVQVIDERSGEDLIKGALSDCLKNCAKHFGVGIDLYGPDLEAGEMPRQQPPVNRQNGAGATPRPAQGYHNGNGGPPQGPPRNPELISIRQIEFIRHIAQEHGMSVEELEGDMMQTYGKPLDEIGKRDASAYIETLKSRRPPVEMAS